MSTFAISDEIIELAEFIAEENSSSNVVYPDRALKNEGVILVPGDFDDAFDGLLEHRDGEFYAYCNLKGEFSLSTPRVRFTVAHEAGHYFIDHHRIALKLGVAPSHPSRYGSQSPIFIEREADAFASNLLMPSQRILRDSRRMAIGFEAIKKLSDIYQTSLTSTTIRYMDEILEDSYLIASNQHSTPAWACYMAGGCPIYRDLSGLSIENIPEDSATKAAYSTQKNTFNKVLKSTSEVSAWRDFGHHPSWGSTTILNEHVASIGQHGWLTLLWPRIGNVI